MPDVIITPSSGSIDFYSGSTQPFTRYRLDMSAPSGLILDAPLSSSVGVYGPNIVTKTSSSIINADVTINGNFSVFGSTTLFSSSNVYISSSQLYVEDNIITINAFSPYLRYAGLEMYDSGSGTLSSLLWDGQGDYFFISGSGVNGKLITGPDGQLDLTAGYVPKATGSYKLGNSLVYDTGTSIGIGTTSPTTLLTVGTTTNTTSSMTLQGEYQSSTFNNTNIFNFRHGGNDRWRLVTIQNSAASNDFDFRINALSASAAEHVSFVTIKGLSGNVGIGLTNPSYNLHVCDTANTLIGTIAIGNSVYPGLISANASSGEFRIDNRTSAAAGFITFYPNGQAGSLGNEAMRITTAGNVYIGQTAASSGGKLSVAGTMLSSNYPYVASIYENNTTGSGYGGGIGFSGKNAGGFEAIQAAVQGVFETTGSLSSDYRSGLRFLTRGESISALTERMRINYTGNVGIGTSNPQFLLDVVSTSASSILRIGNASNNFGAQLVLAGSNTTKNWVIANQQNLNGTLEFTQTVANGSSSIDTTPSVIINSLGNVGIGTSTASRRIHAYVTTGPVMRLQTSGSNASLEFAPSLGTGNNLYNWLIGAQQNVSNAFEITPSTATNGSTFSSPAVLVTSAGNVGIATTSPTARLHIYASGSALNLLKGVTYNDSNASFYNSSLEYYDTSTTNASTVTKYNCYSYFNKRGTASITGYTIGNFFGYTQIDSGSVSQIWDYSSRIEVKNQATASTLVHFVADAGYVTAQGGVLGMATDRIGFFARSQNQSALTLTNQYGVYIEDLGGSTNNYGIYSNINAASNKYNFYAAGSAINYFSGNVGIGTLSPTYKTEIYSGTKTSAFTGLAISNFNNYDGTAASLVTSQLRFSILETGFNASQRTFTILESGNEVNNSSSDGFFAISTRSTAVLTEKFRINSLGSVGIGITTPSSSLHVRNSGAGNQTLLVLEHSAGYSVGTENRIDFYYDEVEKIGARIAQYYTGEAGNRWGLKFYTNSSTAINSIPALTLMGNNNVGIGTTSPSSSLEISSSTATSLLHVKGAGTWGTSILYVGSNGRIGIGTNSPTYGLVVQNYTTTQTGQVYVNAKLNSSGKGLVIDTNTRTNTENSVLALEVINNSGLNTLAATVGGNVGIGTTSPNAKLNVNSSGSLASGSVVFRVEGTQGSLFSVDDNLSGSLMSVNDISGIPILEVFSDDRVVMGTFNANTLVVTGSRVGIGTNSPAYKLDVYDSSNIDVGRVYNNNQAINFIIGSINNTQYTDLTLFTSNGNAQIFKNRSNTGWGGTDALNIYTSNGAIAFHPGTYQNAVYLATNGNVGISTTSPGALLELSSSTASSLFNIKGAGGNGILFVSGSGNVGIGTTNPISKLHISSSTAANVLLESGTSGTSGKIIFKTSDNADLSKYIVQESYYLLFNANSNEGFKFRDSSNTTLMTVYGTTNSSYANKIGMGTTTPIGKLEVNGGSLATTSGSSIIVGSFSSGVSNSSYLNIIETRFATGSDWQTARTRIQKTIDVTDQAYIDFNPSGSLYGLAIGTGAGGNERIRIDNIGNVGIGTSIPTQKLEVQGNGLFGNDNVTTIGLRLTRLNSGYRTSEHTYHSSQNSPWYTYGQHLTWTGELSGIVETSQNYRPYFESFSPAGGYKVFGFMNVNTGSFTSANIINALVIKNDGNVGIGTTTPAAVLNVKTSTVANREVFMGDSTAVAGVFRARLDDNSLSFVSIENRDTNATTDHGVGIRFNLGTTASSNAINAGGIYLGKEQQWTATASTQDSYLIFNTSLDGSASEKVRIKSDGNVGIGTTVVPEKLTVNGNISGSSLIVNSVTSNGNVVVNGTLTCTTLIETSTINVKSNVVSLQNELDKVTKLNPVSFTYKYNNEPSIGLIAEEVAEIYPEFTSKNHDGVAYSKIVSVLIQSIKELKETIDKQQEQINSLLNK